MTQKFSADPDTHVVRRMGYVGNCLLWWRKGAAGYTTDLDQAQRFSEHRAHEIADGNDNLDVEKWDHVSAQARRTVSVEDYN